MIFGSCGALPLTPELRERMRSLTCQPLVLGSLLCPHGCRSGGSLSPVLAPLKPLQGFAKAERPGPPAAQVGGSVPVTVRC